MSITLSSRRIRKSRASTTRSWPRSSISISWQNNVSGELAVIVGPDERRCCAPSAKRSPFCWMANKAAGVSRCGWRPPRRVAGRRSIFISTTTRRFTFWKGGWHFSRTQSGTRSGQAGRPLSRAGSCTLSKTSVRRHCACSSPLRRRASMFSSVAAPRNFPKRRPGHVARLRDRRGAWHPFRGRLVGRGCAPKRRV